MVQVDPQLTQEADFYDELEDNVFRHQDEKMQLHFGAWKDFAEQVANERIELANENKEQALQYLQKLMKVREQFKKHFKNNTATEKLVRSKLAVITQTEEKPDRFFVGDADQFFE